MTNFKAWNNCPSACGKLCGFVPILKGLELNCNVFPFSGPEIYFTNTNSPLYLMHVDYNVLPVSTVHI